MAKGATKIGKAETADVPEVTEEQAIIEEGRDRYQRSSEADHDDRLEAIEDKNFLNGDQWPATLKTRREKDGRPCLVINQLPKFIDQVEGDFRQNKPAIKLSPHDSVSDPAKAEVFEGLIRTIESDSGSGIVYGTALNDIISCGRGAFRVNKVFSDDDSFDQDLKLEEIANVFTVYFDPDSIKYNREDGMYVFVTREISKKVFTARYPDAKATDFDAEVFDTKELWFNGESVRIAEYWRIVSDGTKTLCQLDDGTVVDETELTDDDVVVGDKRVVKKTKVETMIMNGVEILSGPTEWPGKYIPIIGVRGKVININGVVYSRGIIRFARDPQRMYNYWRTSETEAVALVQKAPYVGTKKMFEGHQGWNSVNTTPKPYLTYTPDPLATSDKPTRESPPQYYAGYQTNAQVSSKELMDVTSMFEPALGQRSNETSGKAIIARQTGSDRANIAYTDNLARSMQFAAIVMMDLFPSTYDGARVIRILGPDMVKKYVTINSKEDLITGKPLDDDKMLDMSKIGRYDVTVTVGPSYATKRLEDADNIMQFMSGLPPNQAEVIADLVAGNMDWSNADEIAKRLQATLPPEVKALIEEEEGGIGQDDQTGGVIDGDMDGLPGQGLPEEPADPLIDIQVQQEQAKLDKMQSEAGKAASDAEKADFEANIKEIELRAALKEAEDAEIPLDDIEGDVG